MLARDQFDANDDVELRPVTDVFVRTRDHIRVVTVAGDDGNVEVLRTTDEHPFFVQCRGWVTAGEVRAGDLVQEPDGSWQAVTASVREAHPAGITVYNFEVGQDHTYFVADAETSFSDPVWVHNATGGGCGNVLSRGNDGPRLFGSAVHPTVPPFDGRRALGTLEIPGAGQVYLKSGQSGPAGGRVRNGFTKISNTHVEGHTAALMRDHNLRSADLYINRDPCTVNAGCHVNLPKMLPEGAVLRVHSPSGTTTYVGIPDGQQ